MEIFEALRLDHIRLRDGLDDLIDMTTGQELTDEWAEVFFDLKQSLNAHDRAEETVFYDALTRVPNRQELADIKTEEHHQVEETLQELELIHPAGSGWIQMLFLLRNQIESHIAEEETFVFGLLQGVISDEESEQMGDEFRRLRDRELMGREYRFRAVGSRSQRLHL